MIIINYGYQISYPYSIKKNLNSAQSPTTVGPASVSWARDLARATPVTWAGQLSSPQQQLHSYNADTPLPLQCTVLYVLMGYEK